MREPKQPDSIIRVGGKEFKLYMYFDEALGEELLNLPNFEEQPEYTAEGRPFALAVQESCEYGDSGDASDPDPGDCGGCVHFHREQTPYDAIGVCICEAMRRDKGGDS